MKKIISLLLIVILSLGILASCGAEPIRSDEDMIRDRISAFTKAYNDGDWEGVMQCLDNKTRRTFEAMMNIAGGIGSGVLGFEIDLRDLFTLGVNVTGVSFSQMNIVKIERTSETGAIVTTSAVLHDSPLYFYYVMVKENGNWFISDMTDVKPGSAGNNGGGTNTDNNNGGTGNNNGGTANGGGDSSDGKVAISKPNLDYFVDGLALVYEGGAFSTYWQVINLDGEVIYATKYGTEEDIYDHEWMHLGGGIGCSHITYISDMSEVYDIINSSGETVASSKDGDFDKVICGGDGYAVVYKCDATISSIDHKYGVINANGEWVYEMTSLGVEYETEVRYMGEGMFLIPEIALLGAANASIIPTNISLYDAWFKNGKLYVYGNWDGHCLYGEDGEEIPLPQNYVLYKDGNYTPLSDAVNDRGYTTDDTIVEEFDGKYYIGSVHDVTDDGEITDYYVLDDYAADQIDGLFYFLDGDYALLTIHGRDEKKYVTLVDKQANIKFEPVCIGEYFGTYAEYNDGVIICGANGEYTFVLDEEGNEIISKDAQFWEIKAFHDGVAVAVKDGGLVCYINKQGDIVIDEFYK